MGWLNCFYDGGSPMALVFVAQIFDSGGTAVGTTISSSAVPLDLILRDYTLGGPTSTWGLSGSQLTAEWVNANLRVGVRATEDAAEDRGPGIDSISTRVYYTEASGVKKCRTSVVIGIGPAFQT